MFWFKLSHQEEIFWESFKVGEKVDIILEMSTQGAYASSIAEISKNGLLLAAPRFGSAILELKEKTKIKVKIYTSEGVFKFKSMVTAQDWQTGSISITKPSRMERAQNRQYYRLNIILPVQYGVLPGHKAVPDIADKTPLNLLGVTKNISEGGILMVGDTVFSVNERLKLQVNLGPRMTVQAIAEVLEQRSMDIENKYDSRLQFIKISEDDKETLRKFIILRTRRQD